MGMGRGVLRGEKLMPCRAPRGKGIASALLTAVFGYMLLFVPITASTETLTTANAEQQDAPTPDRPLRTRQTAPQKRGISPGRLHRSAHPANLIVEGEDSTL